MNDIYGTKKGNIRITDNFGLYGTLLGNATVPKGRKLTLYGIVEGDVIVERGGWLEHWGMIAHNLYDHMVATSSATALLMECGTMRRTPLIPQRRSPKALLPRQPTTSRMQPPLNAAPFCTCLPKTV